MHFELKEINKTESVADSVFTHLSVKGGVHCIEVLAVELILHLAQGFTEALEVHDFTLAQETDDVVYIGVIGQTQDVVISGASFLFRTHVFHQVGDDIALHLHGCGSPRCTRCKLRIYPCGVIHEIHIEAALFDLLHRKIAGQLMNQRAHHLKMPQLLNTQ